MRVDVLTIFPDFFKDTLEVGIIRSAIEKRQLKVNVHDLRDFARGRVVDDYPYGGGSGMVMMARPILKAAKAVRKKKTRYLMLTAAGKRLNQKRLEELSRLEHIVLICGRYKGIDYRVIRELKPSLVSIGDYVISGGESAALVLIDGLARLLPGVLGDPRSAETDSFACGILDTPYYTRPRTVNGMRVPMVLVSGNHQAINLWRFKESLRLTMMRRPDLLKERLFNKEELKLLLEVNDESS